MCCVLKAAAQRVILRGEHAKVALDLHLCLWDFGWMFGSLTVSWGGEGEWFLRVVSGVALNQFCASEDTCCWFCSVLVRVSSLCRTTEWLRMEGPSVGHQSKPLFQLAQVLSQVGAFSSCVLIICKADFYPAEMAQLLCPCQVFVVKIFILKLEFLCLQFVTIASRSAVHLWVPSSPFSWPAPDPLTNTTRWGWPWLLHGHAAGSSSTWCPPGPQILSWKASS